MLGIGAIALQGLRVISVEACDRDRELDVGEVLESDEAAS
jgi:hypothetical protein